MSPHDTLFSMSFWQFEGDTHTPPIASDPAAAKAAIHSLEETVKLYNRAILYGEPSGRADAERQAILSVLALRWGSTAPAAFKASSAFMQKYLEFRDTLKTAAKPRTILYSAENAPVLAREILASATISDLRQVGLLAYFLGDTRNAQAAWIELEQRGGDDPFVAGMLGILYLLNEQPQLAYPRLRSAMIAFPESPHFTMFTADAASRIGDSVKARQYLAAAIGMPGHDGGAAFRIEMAIRVTEGDTVAVLEEVRREYCAHGPRKSPVLTWQLSKMVEHAASGELGVDRALELATLSASEFPPARKALLQFRHLAESWWMGLSPEQQLELARRAIKPSTPQVCDWRDRFCIALGYSGTFDIDSTPAWKEMAARQKVIEERGIELAGPYPQNAASPAHRTKVMAAVASGRTESLAKWLLTGEGPVPEGLEKPAY